jgi:hypothetical protein
LAIAILTVVLLAIVIAVVSAPLRRTRAPGRDARDELEAAREAKYREIRDADLDFRTGKLSAEDYQTIDTELRAEAIEILNRLEELRPRDA